MQHSGCFNYSVLNQRGKEKGLVVFAEKSVIRIFIRDVPASSFPSFAASLLLSPFQKIKLKIKTHAGLNYELWGEKIYIFHFTQQIQQVKTHIKPKYNQTFVWFEIPLVGSVMGAE